MFNQIAFPCKILLIFAIASLVKCSGIGNDQQQSSSNNSSGQPTKVTPEIRAHINSMVDAGQNQASIVRYYPNIPRSSVRHEVHSYGIKKDSNHVKGKHWSDAKWKQAEKLKEEKVRLRDISSITKMPVRTLRSRFERRPKTTTVNAPPVAPSSAHSSAQMHSPSQQGPQIPPQTPYMMADSQIQATLRDFQEMDDASSSHLPHRASSGERRQMTDEAQISSMIEARRMPSSIANHHSGVIPRNTVPDENKRQKNRAPEQITTVNPSEFRSVVQQMTSLIPPSSQVHRMDIDNPPSSNHGNSSPSHPVLISSPPNENRAQGPMDTNAGGSFRREQPTITYIPSPNQVTVNRHNFRDTVQQLTSLPHFNSSSSQAHRMDIDDPSSQIHGQTSQHRMHGSVGQTPRNARGHFTSIHGQSTPDPDPVPIPIVNPSEFQSFVQQMTSLIPPSSQAHRMDIDIPPSSNHGSGSPSHHVLISSPSNENRSQNRAQGPMDTNAGGSFRREQPTITYIPPPNQVTVNRHNFRDTVQQLTSLPQFNQPSSQVHQMHTNASFSALPAPSSSPVPAVPPNMPSSSGLPPSPQPSAAGKRLRTTQASLHEHGSSASEYYGGAMFSQMTPRATDRSPDPSVQVPAPSPGPQTPGTPSFDMSLSAINRARQLFETFDDATSRGTGTHNTVQQAPSAVVAVPSFASNMPSTYVMHTQPYAPSVHAAELAPNVPSSSVLRQSAHVPSFASNMPSTSVMHTQPYAPSVHAAELAPNVPSSSVLRQSAHVPSFASNMPSTSVSQRLRTGQANIVAGQGTSNFARPVSGNYGGGNDHSVGHGNVWAMPSQQTGGPSSRHGALPEHLRQPLPWEQSSRGHPAGQFQPLSTHLSSANYNTASAAPSSSRINQTNTLQPIVSSMRNRTLNPALVAYIMDQSQQAASGRVNTGPPSAAAPSRTHSSEGDNM